MKKIFLLVLIAIIFVSGCTQSIGGDRDSHGCLGPAGYTFDEDLNVCTRDWELTDSNVINAAKIAVKEVEQYGLTLEQIESYGCEGCYIISLSNPDYEQITITLENWEVVENTIIEVHGYHILVETEQEATDLKEQIDNGADFSSLAELYSTCPSGQSGGDLGWFGRGAMVAEFDQASFTLEIDEVSNPVHTQFGWHLILITEQR